MQAVQAIQPERFGRYVLLDRIGEGGMAEVFRAIMPGAEGFKRTFVIKKILGRLSESGAFVDMFVREARICALLNHPNIVQVFDFGNVDGHYFLAMEYVPGRDVLAIIRRLRNMKCPFPIAVAAYIAHEVAGCLAYAHALTGVDGQPLGIVHRDVTPSNVMCLREGGVKLLDFGIASAVAELHIEQTEQGTFKGKLPYVAPERLRNEPLDGRSDLYSLGVMLWEMLTCRRLFRGSSEAETFRNVLDMVVPPPSSLRPDVPRSLDAIVARMLERDRDKRYQAGKALANDLEEVLRECDFRAKMVPELLIELFGSGIHSSQVALSCLTPELLSSVPAPESAPFGSGSVSSTPIRVHRRLWPVWAAGGAVVLATVLAWGAHAGWFSPARARSSAAAPVAKTATPLPAPPPAAAAVVPAPALPPPSPALEPPADNAPSANVPVTTASLDASAVSRGNAKAAVSIKRAPSPPRPGAIAKGKSIDPFAEAARRGHP